MRSLYHNFISILYVVFLRWLAAELTGILSKNALVENSFESVNRSARNFWNKMFVHNCDYNTPALNLYLKCCRTYVNRIKCQYIAKQIVWSQYTAVSNSSVFVHLPWVDEKVMNLVDLKYQKWITISTASRSVGNFLTNSLSEKQPICFSSNNGRGGQDILACVEIS